MNKEIKEILEELKEKDETYKKCSKNEIIENEYYKSHVLLDYITNLQEDVYEYEQLIDIQDNREYHKRYLEERRKEQPNLLYPDYDEIYKRYYEQKDTIDKLQERIDKVLDFITILEEDNQYNKSEFKIIYTRCYFGSFVDVVNKISSILKGDSNE